jgi:hypothetical protein
VASLNIVRLLLGAGGNISFTSEMLWALPRDATILADSSHVGCIRGLVCSEDGRQLTPFMIDDQDKDSTTCGQFSDLAAIPMSLRDPVLFDGYRGTLCSAIAVDGGRSWRIEVAHFA